MDEKLAAKPFHVSTSIQQSSAEIDLPSLYLLPLGIKMLI
jgi:hypothetical protein